MRKTIALGIASSYHELIQNDFLGEAYPPFDPVRGPKKDFSLFIGVPDSKSGHKMLALTNTAMVVLENIIMPLSFIVWCII